MESNVFVELERIQITDHFWALFLGLLLFTEIKLLNYTYFFILFLGVCFGTIPWTSVNDFLCSSLSETLLGKIEVKNWVSGYLSLLIILVGLNCGCIFFRY